MSRANQSFDNRNWMGEARSRLARRRGEKPATKAGQIRALWPEIATALQGGQSVTSICQWLEEDAGIMIGVTSLTSYISRIRRRQSSGQNLRNSPPPETVALAARDIERERAEKEQHPGPSGNADPIAQAMSVLTKPRLDIRTLHSDGDPTGKTLI